jgi:curved DNA-binding protein
MDYYKILNVEKNASQEEIKKNYRKLSLKTHPDKGGDENKFKELNEAFQVLGDENKRKEYDFKLQFGNRNTNMGFNMQENMGIPPDILNMNMGFNMRENMGIPVDIINMMFGGENIPGNMPFFKFYHQ